LSGRATVIGTDSFCRLPVIESSTTPEPSGQLSELGLPPWVRQTVKTQFAVRCKFLDRQDHFNAF
jgi:hypothetical protein